MSGTKDEIVHLIEQNAARKVSDLSSEYVRAKSGEKEALAAAIDTERWLAESCGECLD